MCKTPVFQGADPGGSVVWLRPVLMAVAIGADFDGDLGSSAFLYWIRWRMDFFFPPLFDPDHGRLEKIKRN